MKGSKRFLRVLIAGLGVALVSITFGSHASAAILLDGNFDRPADGDGGVNYDASTAEQPGAVDWVTYGAPPIDPAYTESDLNTAPQGPAAHSGTQTVKLIADDAANPGVLQQTFAVTPGLTYTATVWGMNSSIDPLVGASAGFINIDGIAADGSTVVFTVDGATEEGRAVIQSTDPMDTWIQGFCAVLVPTSGVSYLRVDLVGGPYNGGTGSGGSAFMDDAEVTVPEPAGLALLALCGVPVLMRWRRID
jgi:hypothetical protein